MNNNNYILIIILILLGCNKFCICQNILFETQSPIKQLSITEDGRLHILTNKDVCQYEGNSKIGLCIPVSKQTLKVIPIRDNNFIVIDKNLLLNYHYNELQQIDTLIDIIGPVKLIDEHLFIGTASGLVIKSMNSSFYHKELFQGQFVNDLAIIGNDTCIVALDNSIALLHKNGEHIKTIKTKTIINHIVTTNEGFVALTEEQELIFYNLHGDQLKIISIGKLKCKKIRASLNELFILSEHAVYSVECESIKLFTSGDFNDILVLNNSVLLAQENQLQTYDITGSIYETEESNYSVFADEHEQIWVGKNKKVILYKDGIEQTNYKIPSTKENLFISAIAVSEQYIFAGTMGDGLFIFDKINRNLTKHILSNQKNNQNNIIQLKLKDDLIWIAYLNGVITLDKSNLIVHKNYGDLLKNNYLYSMEPIQDEHFYIGTSKNGIIEYFNGNMTTILPGESVYSLSSIQDSILFAGTEKSGVFKIINDLPENVFNSSPAYALKAINQDLVLINEKKRLYALNVRHQQSYPLSNLSLDECQLNGISTSNDRTTIVYKNGFLQLKNNRLNALSTIKLDLNQPRQFNQFIPESKTTFEHNQNNFSFYYHLNTYYQNQNSYFKYRMLGLDTTWQTTQENKVDYFNLRAGDYCFEASYGFKPEFNPLNISSYSFSIKKPFWKRNWFYVLSFLLIFFSSWRIIKYRDSKLIQKQSRQRESLTFQLSQLKSQIDPHFLFNSFNSLIGLIEENPKVASKVTEQLSSFYRDVLDFQKKDLINLDDELLLAKNYFALHKIRFENLIDLNIHDFNTNGMVIPLSIQFLIENAIKHNIINGKNPLQINISRTEAYLIVSNNINRSDKKLNLESGHGLKNLKKRYLLLAKSPLQIDSNDAYFKVKIPIVND